MITYNPTTNSLRSTVLVNKRFLEKSIFFKKLFFKKYSSYGRNNSGHITMFHRCRGHKRNYRLLDHNFLRNIPYVIESQEYDPNRSAFINLILYKNGIYSYIISTNNTLVGGVYLCAANLSYINLVYGNRTAIGNLPVGTIVHSVSLNTNESRTQYLRSAGVYGVLIKKEKRYAYIKLPSTSKLRRKEVILKCSLCGFATIGRVSNVNFFMRIKGKAGRNIWVGKKPITRGIAMNACDHAHGGGRGRTSPPSSPSNRWKTILKHSRKFKRDKNLF